MRCTPPDVLAWSAAIATARPWRPEAERVVVIAPHPDDEAVMFGGLIAQVAASGGLVELVAVTDGDDAYPGQVTGEMLAETRRSEQVASVESLGIASSRITRLGMSDGRVADREDDLVDALASFIDDHVDLIVAPWEHDHHTDHEACGRAVRRAAAGRRRPPVLAYGLFWSLLRTTPPADLVLHAVALTSAELRRKRHAIECHRSQVTSQFAPHPVLGEPELAISRWTREHYVVTTP